MTVADLIRTHREGKGWTQDQLAENADLEKSTVYRIEKGDSSPRGATRRKLADALGIPIETLRQAAQQQQMDHTLDPAGADLLRTLRHVWNDLDHTQQMDLLRQALNLAADNHATGTDAKTRAS